MQNRVIPFQQTEQSAIISIIKNPWDKKVTNIIIDILNKKEIILLEDRKAFVYVANALVDGKSIPLNSLNYDKELKLSVNTKYEIIFKYLFLGEERKIELPKEMNRNLLNFLSGGRRKNECCMDFINDLYFGCNSERLNNINLQGLPIPIEDNKNLIIGQAVSVGSERESQFVPNHFAIYLGGDLYLSVMGTNIPLYVTTLEQMKMIYNDQKAAIVVPILECDSKPVFSVKI